MKTLAQLARQESILGGPRWRRRKADRPIEILEAALAVFGECSVSAATIDEIAARAGVKRSTIYLYFKNKEHIFGELTRSFLPVMPDSYTLNVSLRPRPAADQLREVVRLASEALTEPRTAALLRLVVAEARNFPRVAREYREAVAERLQRPIVTVIERGITQGKFRHIDPHLAARLAITVPSFTAIWDTPWNLATLSTGVNAWDPSAFLAAHIELFIATMTAASFDGEADKH